MCNVSIAKDRVKTLTTKLEKDLYLLKYRHEDFIKMTDEVYDKIKELTDEDSSGRLTFPFKKVGDNIYLNGNDDNLYKSLHILAEEFHIVLNYMDMKKIY